MSLQVFYWSNWSKNEPVDQSSTKRSALILVQLNGFALDSSHQPGLVQPSCIRGIAPAADALQSCLLLPSPHPLAPLPRHPRNTGTARRRRLAGEPRAAEGGAVQTRCSHRSCPVGGCSHLPLGSASATGTADPTTDAPAQRHRGLEHDAENGLAPLFTTRALTA